MSIPDRAGLDACLAVHAFVCTSRIKCYQQRTVIEKHTLEFRIRTYRCAELSSEAGRGPDRAAAVSEIQDQVMIRPRSRLSEGDRVFRGSDEIADQAGADHSR